jgi:hypothetical protein
MRCFHCGGSRARASAEHVPSAFLGSRLKTRRVCQDCNERAGREIDARIATYLMVQKPKALADVRSLRSQHREPSVEVDAIVSTTGEPVRVRFSPNGREAWRADGSSVTETIEISYGFDSDLWVQFTAKVALGCAAQLFEDDWLDERMAVALRSVLWHGPIDPQTFPDGVPGWPDELAADHPVRQGLGDQRHLVGLVPSDRNPGSSVAMALLFGGQIACRLPLRGVDVEGIAELIGLARQEPAGLVQRGEVLVSVVARAFLALRSGTEPEAALVGLEPRRAAPARVPDPYTSGCSIERIRFWPRGADGARRRTSATRAWSRLPRSISTGGRSSPRSSRTQRSVTRVPRAGREAIRRRTVASRADRSRAEARGRRRPVSKRRHPLETRSLRAPDRLRRIARREPKRWCPCRS